MSKRGNVLKNGAIKVYEKAIEGWGKATVGMEKYGKALAAESEIAAGTAEVNTTAAALEQTSIIQTNNIFNTQSAYFAVLGSSITGATMIGSSNTAVAAPVTVTNIDLPATYKLRLVETTEKVTDNYYKATGYILWTGGVTENVYLEQYEVQADGRLPSRGEVLPKGYETFLKNNPGFESAGTPIIFENNTMTTGTPAPGLLDGLWDLLINSFKWW